MSDAQNTQTETEQEAPETVALAREMGWKPETEWRGDPPKGGFTSATEYVRKGEKILPIVNARARKAEERATKLESELEQVKRETRDTIARIEKMSTVALEQQRTQIERNYATLKENAVETGDKAAYAAAVKGEKDAVKALDDRLADEPDDKDKKAKTETKGLPKEHQEVIDAWLDKNQWFNSEPELNGAANGHYNRLSREKPGMSEQQKLDSARAYVVKKFPEYFGEGDEPDDEEPERPRASRVEGGSRLNGGGGKKTGYGAMPAEAKAACDRFIKDDKLFLEPGETVEKNLSQARERYATKYFGDEK